MVHGKNLANLLSFELITDGDISFIEYSNAKNDECYYEDPMYPNSYRTLKANRVVNVSLKDASFAIKQGLCNDEIRYSIVNTEIIDSEVLKEIMNMANQKYSNDNFTLTEQKPFVRKLILK